MAEKSFTEKQREIVARKMGYEGPMNMFDSYLKSSPADARKYGLITETFMARGGMVKKNKKVRKMAEGGDVGGFDPDWYLAQNPDVAANWAGTPQQHYEQYGISEGRAGSAGTTTAGTTTAGTTTTTTDTTAGTTTTAAAVPTAESVARKQAIARMYGEILGRPADEGGLNYWANSGLSLEDIRLSIQGSQEGATAISRTEAQEAAAARVREAAPDQPGAASVTAAQIASSPDQFIDTQLAPEKATTVTAAAPARTALAAAPEVTPAATMEAATSREAVVSSLMGMQGAQGTVSPEAQVQAAQVVPTETAIGGLEAAQTAGTQITDIPKRVLATEELVSGSAVDQAKIEAALAKNVAAQGVVEAEMTIQGQLNKLYTDFEMKNPPAWAAGSLRNANAVLSARGLGASSLAGQAVIQATLEAALPIAAADAQTFAQMGLQNLSNRQQMAVLTGQQRAAYLGQEFDQAFQTKVLNAAKVSDIANANFGAEIQVTLENARMAQTADLANLNNRQALVMAKAAQIANLEAANLNNRQQAAVVNAQAFLQMDLTNLANTQQTELFKAQSTVQSLLTDTAAENAARQFNATSENQTNQFFASLETQVSQFNASQTNAMSQFNVDQANSVAKFNAEAQNLRDQFNAQNRLVIDQSNAQWRREIATANTAATNRANEFNATKAQEITMVEYNNQWQQFRDELEYSWRSAENTADRNNRIAITEIQSNANILTATMAKDAELTKTIANSAGKILGGLDVGGVAKAGLDLLVKGGSSLYDAGVGLYDTLFGTSTAFSDYVPAPEGYQYPNFEE